MRLAGVVLAGGVARRLGGVDKPLLTDATGRPLLRAALDALRAADPVVVVGPRRPGFPRVSWTREGEPGSGPVAALAAGLGRVDARVGLRSLDAVALLAADLPGVTPDTIDRLRGALAEDPDADGAVLVDADDRRQWLLGVWRPSALRSALPVEPRGASLRGTLGESSIVEVRATPGEADDVDTPDDLARLTGSRTLHRRHTGRGVG